MISLSGLVFAGIYLIVFPRIRAGARDASATPMAPSPPPGRPRHD